MSFEPGPDRTPILCGNVPFVRSNPQQAVTWLMELARSGQPTGQHIHFANAWSVVIAERDHEFREALASGICFPDGLPIVWASKLLDSAGPSALQRVRGPSFFEDFIGAGVPLGVRHYFLGSTEKTLHDLQSSLEARIGQVEIAGVSSPPFRELSDQDWRLEIDKITASGAHIVWVGLGTPKQDLAALRLSRQVSLPFVCVGAAFDFSAGNLKAAPKVLQATGLEWLYRFVQEPRRLWRRYLVGNVQFVGVVARQLLWKSRHRSTGGVVN